MSGLTFPPVKLCKFYGWINYSSACRADPGFALDIEMYKRKIGCISFRIIAQLWDESIIKPKALEILPKIMEFWHAWHWKILDKSGKFFMKKFFEGYAPIWYLIKLTWSCILNYIPLPSYNEHISLNFIMTVFE